MYFCILWIYKVMATKNYGDFKKFYEELFFASLVSEGNPVFMDS